jgi:hypothetical protein
MATCGWLITGAVTSVPYDPTLVIVNVPPVRSSAVRRFERALTARAAMSSLSARSRFPPGGDDDRDHERFEVHVDATPRLMAGCTISSHRRRRAFT